MTESQVTQDAFRYSPILFGGLAATVALASLLGHAGAGPWVYQTGGTLIPFAPQAALITLLVALGVALPWIHPGLPALRRGALGCLATALLLNVLTHIVWLSGPSAPPSQWIIHHILDASRISPLTALAHSAAILAFGLGSLGDRWSLRQAGALTALVLLGFDGLMGLSYVAGSPFLYGLVSVPMSSGAALSSVFLALGLLCSHDEDVWPMVHFARKAPLTQPQSFLRNPLTILGILALIVLGGTTPQRRTLVAQARSKAEQELALVADQKAGQIARWHQERLLDAQQMLHQGLIQNQLQLFVTGSPHAPSPEVLMGWMLSLQDSGYQALHLYDAKGNRLLSTQPATALPAAVFQAALQADHVTEVDPQASPMHIVLCVPVGPRPNGPALGLLALSLDAEPALLPILQSWPSLATSAETLLLRRVEDRMVYLSGRRHPTSPAVATSVGIQDNPQLPVVQALKDGAGIYLGPDYRHIRVVAAIRMVPGTSWWMAAKLDESEIFAPVRYHNWQAVMALTALVLLLGLVINITLRSRDHQLTLSQLALERERKFLAERFRHLMLQANDTILLIDAQGQIIEASDRIEEVYGYTSHELTGKNIHILRAPGARSLLEDLVAQSLAGKPARLETIHQRKDGSTFPVEISSRAVTFGDETYLLSFLHDITDRRQQALALARVSRLYSALSQINQTIVWSTSREELFQRICSVLVQFGSFEMVWIGQQDAGTHTVTPICHAGKGSEILHSVTVRSDDSPLGRGPMGTAIRTNQPSIHNNFFASPELEPWHTFAAEAGFSSAAAFPVRSAGEPLFGLGVYASAQDFFGKEEVALLTEAAMDLSYAVDHLAQDQRRTQAEEALRRSENILKAVTENAPDIITMMDSAGNILYINRVLPGIPLSKVLGQNWLLWIPKEHQPLAEEARVMAMATGEQQEFELQGAGPEGSVSWYRSRLSPIRGSMNGEAMVLFSTDITQARKAQADQALLEAQLAQSQKLESLGSLAGGVAHDMNNVLGAILSLASAHREQLATSDPFAPSLDTIVNACLRGRGVVKSLLYFAHKDLDQVSAIDVNAMVKEMVQFLAYTTLKRIKLEMNLQEGLGRLQGDLGALSNTLMNLCVNAMDAMPGGGSLTIRTHGLPDGSLELRVQDTGFGMSKDVLEKAMEPFFTTKPQGKGTGLGLSMAYATMKAHEGTLQILSTPGQGTEAILTFPASRVGATQEVTSTTQAYGFSKGTPMRILLVDDDELIRASVAPMLQILGHTVSTAPGGLEAITLLKEGLEVDLIILDMNMPGLNGADTLPLLLELRPHQRILMSTGYSDQDISTLLEGRPGVFSIRKPFSLPEILSKFEEINRVGEA